MQIPALATAIKAVATKNLRRQQAFAEQRRQDRKLAQANDYYDHD